MVRYIYNKVFWDFQKICIVNNNVSIVIVREV